MLILYHVHLTSLNKNSISLLDGRRNQEGHSGRRYSPRSRVNLSEHSYDHAKLTSGSFLLVTLNLGTANPGEAEMAGLQIPAPKPPSLPVPQTLPCP